MAAYTSQQLALILHVFPLPYHRTAFLAAQASLVLEQKSPALFWAWSAQTVESSLFFIKTDWLVQYCCFRTDTIFQKQGAYFNAPTANMSNNAITEALTQLVVSNGWISKAEFLAGMNSDALNWNARVSWKWAAGRGVYGTPMFMVNGVIAPNVGSDWTLAQWQQFLNPLFQPSQNQRILARPNMS